MRIFGKETVIPKELLYIKRNIREKTFVQWLLSNYDAIRCYHACRPIDISSYYQKGLVPSNIDQSVLKFEEFLKKVNCNLRADLSKIINESYKEKGKFIYFILDKCDYYTNTSHYWIYGSEFILNLAQNTSFHLKKYLREIGIPTIFTCDIPLSKIKAERLTYLYDRIKQASGKSNQILHNVFSNYTIIIEPLLEGKFIIDHEHPTEQVWDFHTNSYYKNDLATCPICQ